MQSTLLSCIVGNLTLVDRVPDPKSLVYKFKNKQMHHFRDCSRLEMQQYEVNLNCAQSRIYATKQRGKVNSLGTELG